MELSYSVYGARGCGRGIVTPVSFEASIEIAKALSPARQLAAGETHHTPYWMLTLTYWVVETP